MSRIQRKEIGSVGVDSGQVIILDPCYAPQVDYKAVLDMTGGKTVAPFSPEEWRALGCGVASRTQYGDGIYPVFALYRDGEIVGLEIRFDKECA
jgi:hypothetical protein